MGLSEGTARCPGMEHLDEMNDGCLILALVSCGGAAGIASCRIRPSGRIALLLSAIPLLGMCLGFAFC